MIALAGLDWLWWTLAVLGLGACVWAPTWMHGRTRAEDEYDRGMADAEELAIERVAHDGLELTMGPRGPRWQSRGHAALLAAPLPPELEEYSLDAATAAELHAFVAEMTARSQLGVPDDPYHAGQ